MVYLIAIPAIIIAIKFIWIVSNQIELILFIHSYDNIAYQMNRN